MKTGLSDGKYKEVVIIGNGPSGIALSYMLDGNLPFVISNDHPDEMLSTRLKEVINKSLIQQNLEDLSTGLEGRTTNPVSLLLDALAHPCADIGLEMEPLIEWKKCGVKIDHIVLGKGPPGGSWHRMDPNILTLSLGSWMALPGFPYLGRDSGEKRAFASNVAQYYKDYVDKMNLSCYFKSDVTVTSVQYLGNSDKTKCDENNEHIEEAEKLVCKIDDDILKMTERCVETFSEQKSDMECKKEKSCSLSRVLNFITLRGNQRLKTNRCCKRPRDNNTMKNDCSPDRKIRDVIGKSTSPGSCNRGTVYSFLETSYGKHDNTKNAKQFSCDFRNFRYPCDKLCNRYFSEQNDRVHLLRNSHSLDFGSTQVPYDTKIECQTKANLTNCGTEMAPTSQKQNTQPKWCVQVYDTETKAYTTYLCKYLVLANGTNDLPNRLTICSGKKDPSWLLHDVRSLEIELDRYLQSSETNSPVVVVGAGLSAADAIIAARGRNVPVIHVFRNKTAALNKHLPENMYPEYHKVHQMMKDGGSTYPLYKALPEYTLTDFDETARTITLISPAGDQVKYCVSFLAVLIGSRPDLSFLPADLKLGVNKEAPIDCKTNTISINKFTHRVCGAENLFAIGPLAGDNFVRFIPGGALAVVNDIYRTNGWNIS